MKVRHFSLIEDFLQFSKQSYEDDDIQLHFCRYSVVTALKLKSLIRFWKLAWPLRSGKLWGLRMLHNKKSSVIELFQELLLFMTNLFSFPPINYQLGTKIVHGLFILFPRNLSVLMTWGWFSLVLTQQHNAQCLTTNVLRWTFSSCSISINHNHVQSGEAQVNNSWRDK